MAAGARSPSERAGGRSGARRRRPVRALADAAAALERAPAPARAGARAAAATARRRGCRRSTSTSGPGNAFDDHVALIADDACGRMIGRAAFQRVYGPRAVLELDVDPALWHLGLPAILLERLCARAARAGIVVFIARVPGGAGRVARAAARGVRRPRGVRGRARRRRVLDVGDRPAADRLSCVAGRSAGRVEQTSTGASSRRVDAARRR